MTTANDIRNFSLVGHGTSGKTVLSDAILYNGGETNRIGKTENGNTISDYHHDEISREISLSATLLHCNWLEKKLNIIDVPGFFDFVGEAKSALRVSDFAVAVVHGVTGPEAGTDIVWDFATDYGIPKILVVNMMNKEHTKFDTVLSQLQSRYSKRVFPFTIPVNPGPGFNQVADVLRKELLTYSSDSSGKFQTEELSGDWKDRVDQLHEELIEYIAESDDSLLEKFFEQGNLSEEELRAGLHDAIINGSVIPLVCTAADANVGVTRLMDIIAKYCPSPDDFSTTKAFKAGSEEEIEVKASDPESLFVFKTVSEAHVGELSFFRVYSGEVKHGMDLKNSSRHSSERLGQLFIMNGKNRKEVGGLGAGDLGFMQLQLRLMPAPQK